MPNEIGAWVRYGDPARSYDLKPVLKERIGRTASISIAASRGRRWKRRARWHAPNCGVRGFMPKATIWRASLNKTATS